MNSPRLTQYTQFAGCGAKLGPGLLDRALCDLAQPKYKELLVDYTTADDAGVYQVDEDTALVQTVDFFPPIVDDSYAFGQIAAANALSDIYAMGGRPVTALSIVTFPTEKLEIQLLRRIMEGALNKLEEAGAPLVGGHSINDPELKFGLAVTGLIHPSAVLKNGGLQPGDKLILTKPLGTGTINTAMRAGKASETSVAAATESMTTLNKRASEILTPHGVHAMTDVTGFGLAGHVCEMLQTGPVSVVLDLPSIALLPDVREHIAGGYVPGGTGRNREFRLPWIENAGELSEEELNLLFDPQTSGGLLAALPEDAAERAVAELQVTGVPAFVCGRVEVGHGSVIVNRA
ncbi:MAG: selenide, water dikinase SelD [Spirochaetaceae bacterium]